MRTGITLAIVAAAMVSANGDIASAKPDNGRGHASVERIGSHVEAQANPGGHSVVLYFGLASPVQTPLLGPPVSVFD
jgi:hypothetical protein